MNLVPVTGLKGLPRGEIWFVTRPRPPPGYDYGMQSNPNFGRDKKTSQKTILNVCIFPPLKTSQKRVLAKRLTSTDHLNTSKINDAQKMYTPGIDKKVFYKKIHCLESENSLLWLALWFGGTACFKKSAQSDSTCPFSYTIPGVYDKRASRPV